MGQLAEGRPALTRAQIQGRIDLDRQTFDALVAHAHSDAPYEVCGFLAGADGQVSRHYEIPNAARSMTFYTMDAKAMLQAMNDMDDRGIELIAIYHSHTHTEAFPSATDVELAAYPDAVYLIISLQDDTPIVRGYDIVEHKITERIVFLDGDKAPAGKR
ncbi:M67 family metallopeptidase [soil metagenome]